MAVHGFLLVWLINEGQRDFHSWESMVEKRKDWAHLSSVTSSFSSEIKPMSFKNILTFHRCRCRRCGAFHLWCSSSAGTGWKKHKYWWNDQHWRGIPGQQHLHHSLKLGSLFYPSIRDPAHWKPHQSHLTSHHQNADQNELLQSQMIHINGICSNNYHPIKILNLIDNNRLRDNKWFTSPFHILSVQAWPASWPEEKMSIWLEMWSTSTTLHHIIWYSVTAMERLIL